jgi:hypothetical protein
MSAKQKFTVGQRVRFKRQREVFRVRAFVRHDDCEPSYILHRTRSIYWQSQLVKA